MADPKDDVTKHYENGHLAFTEKMSRTGRVQERAYVTGPNAGVTEFYRGDGALLYTEKKDGSGQVSERSYKTGLSAGVTEHFENGKLAYSERQGPGGETVRSTPDTAAPGPKTFEQQIRGMAAQSPGIINRFGGEEQFETTVAKIGQLDAQFQQTGGAFFHLGSTPKETAENFTSIHIDQYRDNARPSLPALVAHHLDEIGLSRDSPHYKAAILVAARAEVDLEKTPQYHNKNHYADVTAQVAEFTKKNNELAEKGVAGAHRLTPEEMADSITAAVAHDIDHPGGKNATPEQYANKEEYYNRTRLEGESYGAIKPLLWEAGLTNDAMNNIQTMILTTSPDGPHDILKAVAKAQQAGTEVDWSKVPNHDKFPELKEALLKDPTLTARAAMLEDADLGASAYYGLEANKKMSDAFTQELQERQYRTGAGTLEDLNGPVARAGFTQFVVKDGPASAAAQAALGDNDKELRAVTAQQITEVKEHAATLPNAIKEMAAQNPDIIAQFGGEEKFRAAMEKIGTLDTKFESRGGVFFHLGSSPSETAEAFTRIHVDNYREVGRPSLPALVAHHLDEIGLAKDDAHYKAALLVASRAEVDLAKTPQYHNTNHYADVTAQVAELVKRNNDLAEKGVPGAQKLTPQEMADSITAAVGHDIEHPGGKNAAPGEQLNANNRLRLEEQSYKTIEPLLKDAGLSEAAMGDIHTMIQTTSPDGPHGILKAIAKAQQEGKTIEWEKLDPNNKMPELKELAERLQKDPKLTARSAILEDSDLGASAFEGLKSNVKMSAGFTQELQERNYNENLQGPSARQGFSDFVVGEGPASAAAQDALGQNYKEMYKDTRAIANQMKTLSVGVWKDDKTPEGRPFSTVDASGLNEQQLKGAMNAMKEAGLSPVATQGADAAKTLLRIEGEDVTRLHAIRDNVIAKMDWKVDQKASEINHYTITQVSTAPLGNDELKAIQNALKSHDIEPLLTEKGKITVTGFNASMVENIKERANEAPAAEAPKAPAAAKETTPSIPVKAPASIENQTKALAAGVWKDGVMVGGTKYSRAEATGLSEQQVAESLAAMKAAGLNPTVEEGTPAGKTIFRVEGDDVAKLHTMRENVIGQARWTTENTTGYDVSRVKTDGMHPEQVKALHNALQAEQLGPFTTEPNTIGVAGYNSGVVQRIQKAAPTPPPALPEMFSPPPPPPPPAAGGGESVATAPKTGMGGTVTPPQTNSGGAATPPQTSGESGGQPIAKVTEAGIVTAAVKTAEGGPKTTAPVVEKPGMTSKFMGEGGGTPNITNSSRMTGVGGTGAGLVGLVMSGQGLNQAIQTGDKTEMALAGTNLVTAGAQTTQSLLSAAGRSAPVLESFGKKLPVVGAAVTVIDGAYQISKEDTTQHKIERGVAVGATVTTGLVLGTATATAAEAGVITAGVTGVLGTGAAAVGTAAVVTAAAPVVLTAAAVVAVAYTGEKAIEAKRAWDGVDKMIADNGAAQKRKNYKSADGKPSVLGYQHIAVALLHHSDQMKNENMNGAAGLERDKQGKFKIGDFKKIDMRDPKNIAELERVLKGYIAKEDKILADSRNVLDNVLPKWMAHGSDTLDKITMAQMERADLTGAMQEIQMYKKDLAAWDAAHPDDPATTGVKAAAAAPPPAQQKPRSGKSPGMG